MSKTVYFYEDINVPEKVYFRAMVKSSSLHCLGAQIPHNNGGMGGFYKKKRETINVILKKIKKLGHRQHILSPSLSFAICLNISVWCFCGLENFYLEGFFLRFKCNFVNHQKIILSHMWSSLNAGSKQAWTTLGYVIWSDNNYMTVGNCRLLLSICPILQCRPANRISIDTSIVIL